MELMQASNQWATRPDDQRFLSLTDLARHVRDARANSVQRVLPNRRLLAAPVEGDASERRLVVIETESGAPVIPTNWAFGQLAGVVGAPAKYLRELPAPLAADCINHGLAAQDVSEVGILLRKDGDELPGLAAVTGRNYGRVWNDDVASALVKRFGDGRTGDFKIPGEFGQQVAISKSNTTLYASDRDMFVFLADEENRIEMKDRRNGKSGSLARGFFVWNSEVGAQTLGIATFLFDYACSNRIVWGATGFKEVRIRHTSGAPHRFIEQVTPALERYAASETHSITAAIEEAQASKIGNRERVDEFLGKRFTRSQVKAINLAHELEEQRPIETLWDAVTGATAYAKTVTFQDERVALERKAGEIMEVAAKKAA